MYEKEDKKIEKNSSLRLEIEKLQGIGSLAN